VYTDGQNTLEFDISPRLKVLKEVLDETENKTLIFIPYRHAITLVSEYLQKLGVSAEVINGDVNPSKRAEIFQKFQTQSDPKVLIIQPQAASHGVTLTAADNVVFWSPVMSLETYLQCIARIDRVGQKNKMTVTHLQGSDVERKLYKALQERKNLHVEMVGMYKKGLGD
jgi:SNF2 family DNA or RNA helicase